VHRLALGPRVGAQLVRQHSAQPLVHRQGLTRPARSLMSQHEDPVGILVQGVGGDRALGQTRCILDVLKLQRGPVRAPPGPTMESGRSRPRLFGPLGVRLVLQQRPVATQLEGPPCGGASQGGLAGGQPGLRLTHHSLGFLHVHLEPCLGDEPVPGPSSFDRFGSKQRSEAADQCGHIPFPSRGGLVTPQDLGYPLRRDHVSTLQQKELQHGATLAAPDLPVGQRRPLAPDGEGTEQLESEPALGG
jgi:hypothetical protein